MDFNFKHDNEYYTVNFELYSEDGMHYVIFGICDNAGDCIHEDMIDFVGDLDLNQFIFDYMESE